MSQTIKAGDQAKLLQAPCAEEYTASLKCECCETDERSCAAQRSAIIMLCNIKATSLAHRRHFSDAMAK